jgi:hypothetical protein
MIGRQGFPKMTPTLKLAAAATAIANRSGIFIFLLPKHIAYTRNRGLLSRLGSAVWGSRNPTRMGWREINCIYFVELSISLNSHLDFFSYYGYFITICANDGISPSAHNSQIHSLDS